jgi:very-short-patch-repair endonuclease
VSDDDTAVTSHDDPLVERAIRLFTFLAQAQQLKNPGITDLDSYKRDGAVVWFNELPLHPSVVTPLRGGTPGHDEPLLVVDRVARHTPPTVSAELTEWLDGRQDDPTQPPTLLAERYLPDESAQRSDPAAPPPHRMVAVQERPDVHAAYELYLGEWRAWAAQDLRDQPARSLYNDLFSTYVRLTGHGEEFELVLGTGLLTWAFPDSKVRRHLLTVALSITFDDDSGQIVLVASETAAGTRVELDMLDPGLHGNPQHVNAVRTAAQDEQSHPLDRDRRGELARRLVHLLSPEAEYQDSDQPAQPVHRPVATFAPALLLRRRSQQGMVEIFRQIVDQIRASGTVPDGVRPLVDPDHIPNPGDSATERSDGALVRVDEDPFLPLPVNDVQLKILRKVDAYAQTVVQGPPGTGKTHTAAVLISHLLAQGRRVLVTAHTDRALKEVRGKLPEPIRPLAVAVVGSSRQDMSDLRVAVERIAANASEYEPHEAEHTISAHLGAIENLRRRRAEMHNRLIAAREREVRVHDVVSYHGTLAAIAAQRESERHRHEWIDQYVAGATGDAPLSDARIAGWRAQLLDASLLADEPLAAERLVDLAQVLDPHAFADLVSAELTITENSARYEPSRARREYTAVHRLARHERDGLGEQVGTFSRELRSLGHRREQWVREALLDVRTDRAQNWTARRDQIARLVEEIEPIMTKLGPIADVQVKDEPAHLVAPAEALLRHVEKGNKVKVSADGMAKVGALSPRVVKDAAGLFERVTVDGCPPTTAAQLSVFLAWIMGDRVLGALDRAWPVGLEIPPEDTLQERLQWHVTELDLLDRIVEIGSWIQRTQRYLRGAGLPSPDWADDEDIAAFAALPEAAAAAEQAIVARQPLSDLARHIASEEHWPDTSEVVRQLLRAVNDRDVARYTAAHERLTRLLQVRREVVDRDDTQHMLATAAPDLAAALRADPAHDEWTRRLAEFSNAWSWAAVGQWIADQETIDVNVLQANVIRIEDNIRGHVQELSATRAWNHAVSPSRLTRGSRAHLEQYARLVRQFGKTGGQYRELRKADIRDAMDRCRSAVPVWIMPLYRIADQLRIEPDMFDVVIVDEASQAGVEATFLQYLAKRIVVIGDDKQVSPSAVGVNRQQLRDLGNQYLYDDRFRATWQEPQQSLFDEAKMRFGGTLTLVEHRRCVPEIIGFSNQIAYEPDNIRLIPVRQFGADRLEPIRTEFVKDGYERGGPSTRTNPPEAEAIVAQLEKCLQDPRYDGLTFGVISLLGSNQARLIERTLQDRIEPQELIARDLRCGDAADFQGAERDVMFLSMVVSNSDPDRRIMALTKTEYVQRYNVAASRAKDQMWLFHSVDPSILGNPEDMRRQLLDYCYGVRQRLAAKDDRVVASALPEDVVVSPFDSRFEQRVCNRLLDRGYTVIPQFESMGYRLDLVVVGAKTRLAVECDGDAWHGPEAHQRDMARQRELERCGWDFFRVLESEFNLNATKALAPLWERLDGLEIHPANWSDPTSDAGANQPPLPVVEPTPIPDEVAEPGSPPTKLVIRERIELTRQPESLIPTIGLVPTELPAVPAPVTTPVPERIETVPTPATAVQASPQTPGAALAKEHFGPPPNQKAPESFLPQPADLLDMQDRLLLLTAAKRRPLTSLWVAQVLAISQTEAREILRALSDAGELVRVGQQRGTRYVLPTWDKTPSDPHGEGSRTFVSGPAQREQILRATRRQSITNEYVQNLLGVSPSAALETLNAMVHAGDLERFGQGRGTRYHRLQPQKVRPVADSPAEEHQERPPARPNRVSEIRSTLDYTEHVRSATPFPWRIRLFAAKKSGSVYDRCLSLQYHQWNTARPFGHQDGPATRCERCGAVRVLMKDGTYTFRFELL